MADNSKNNILNDEDMMNASGGTSDEKGRRRNAVVIGPWNDNPYQQDCYRVRIEGYSTDDAAHCSVIGLLLPPNTKVIVELVGQGRWDIVGKID